MNKKPKKYIVIKGAEKMFRPNFSGNPEYNYGPDNKDRVFTVKLRDNSDNMRYTDGEGPGKPISIEELIKDGWNVRPTRSEEDPEYFISVKVRFDKYPPHIELITSKNATILTEDTVHRLDEVDIENMDVVITPFDYDQSGRTNKKTAYVKSLYVKAEEDFDPFREVYHPSTEIVSKPEEDDIPF